jgi:hypothetical protein
MAINFPNAPTVGQLWPSPAVVGQPVYQWDGQKWIVQAGGASPVYVGDAPPSNPPNGALWWNSANAQLYISYNDGNSTQWVMISAAQVAQTFKNYIINGAMMISQENGSTAGTVSGFYAVDQFFTANSAGSYTVAQVGSLTPSGSPNRLRVTNTAAHATVAAGDFLMIDQRIEGLRVADLKLGTAAAKQLIVRFGVKAPAGTYCVAIRNAALNRSYIAEVVVAAGEANTDVVKSVTIPGDVAGTWAIDNTIGLELLFTLMCGTTYQTAAGTWTAGSFVCSPNQSNFAAINGNVFELFDVGFYQGSVVPPFIVPDFASELQLCQRYFEKSYSYAVAPGTAASDFTEFWDVIGAGAYQMPGAKFAVRKRVVPSITLYSPNSGAAGVVDAVGAATTKPIACEGQNETSFNFYVSMTINDLLRYHWKAIARL